MSRLCDKCHAAKARYLVVDLDLAFCAHHWDEQPETLKRIGFEDWKDNPIPDNVHELERTRI